MTKVIPIVLGSDPLSYSMTRSIYDVYGEKVDICCSRVMTPFHHTKIANIHKASYAKDNYIDKPDVLINLLNKVYRENFHSEGQVILFVPTGIYLETVYDHIDKLDFEPKMPYPSKTLCGNLTNKSFFYEEMERLNVRIPLTRAVDSNDYQELDLDGKLVLKASDNNAYKRVRTAKKDKVFYADNRQEAIEKLKYIYDLGDENKYEGKFIVQEFISGSHGTEYSISGYRSSDDKFSMAQARSIFTDLRPRFIGNHIVLIDSNIEELFELSKIIIRGLDYYGLFNIDMKIHPDTGEIFVFEINPRLARSFYYSNLGGVNLPQLAIEDLGLNNSIIQKQTKPFNWIATGLKECEKRIPPELKNEFMREERYQNTGHSVINPQDNGLLRRIKMRRYIHLVNKAHFGLE